MAPATLRATLGLLTRKRTRYFAVTAPPLLAMMSWMPVGSLPARAPRAHVATGAAAAIESAPICIGSSVRSAGELGDTLYYRATATGEHELTVGYFAFWSEERPWGDNWLTYSVLPALAVDLVYSRALMVAPGLQRAMYGKGDVEGVRVVYSIDPRGGLRVERAAANDGVHEPVTFTKDEVFALDPSRPVFYSDVWSHQLGGKNARSLSDLKYVRCYDREHVRPLTDSIAREFAIDTSQRARPAHVEALESYSSASGAWAGRSGLADPRADAPGT